MPKRDYLAERPDSVDHKMKAPSKVGMVPNREFIRQLAWDIASINVHLEEIRSFWAKTLGITGPQWLILMALAELDQGQGVAVKVVSARLHVDPSFITTQSKILEKKGFMRRRPSAEDGRVVQMSLTDKTYKQIESLSSRRDAVIEFVFSPFDERELKSITDKLATLKNRLEKASQMVAIDI